MENGRWVKLREYCDVMGVGETTARLGKKAGSIKHRMISAKMYQLWLPDDREVAPVSTGDKAQVEHTGDAFKNLTEEQIDKKLSELQRKAGISTITGRKTEETGEE